MKINNLTNPQKTKHDIYGFLIPAFFLLLITYIYFEKFLFSENNKVISSSTGDIFRQFAHWRSFGFTELKNGNIPLWNPYIYSGAPFLGGFQSALFYPPNWIYLYFPLPLALNLEVSIHVFFTGYSFFLWTRFRELGYFPSLLFSVLFMFSGPFFLNVYAGHLSSLATLSWVPLIFLATEGWILRKQPHWCLLGIFSVAMQVLSGHIQFCYYTGLSIVLYGSLLSAKENFLIKGLGGILLMYLGGVLLSSVQLLPGIETALEGGRLGRMSLQESGWFSFPPENLITLIAPGFYGDLTSNPYWGRFLLWEMCLFISITGLFFAVFEIAKGHSYFLKPMGWTFILLLIVSFGEHTPVFKILYHLIPFFDSFRGTSKFSFFAMMFLVLFGGMGYQRFLINPSIGRIGIFLTLLIGILLISTGYFIKYSSQNGLGSYWSDWINNLFYKGSSFIDESTITSLSFIKTTGSVAYNSLLKSGFLYLILAILFGVTIYFKRLKYLIGILALIEITGFAIQYREGFLLNKTFPTKVKAFFDQHPGNHRVKYTDQFANVGMSLKVPSIWGDDPAILGRYSEFMAKTQNLSNKSHQAFSINSYHPLYKMLRLKYLVTAEKKDLQVREFSIMARAQIMDNWIVLKNKNLIFKSLFKPSFNPEKEVILESEPFFSHNTNKINNNFQILESGTDHLILKANVSKPSILVLTDLYSKYWKALSLINPKQTYPIIPANYILMGIPLKSGNHHIVIKYDSPGFRIGRWVSIISIIAFLFYSKNILIKYLNKNQF